MREDDFFEDDDYDVDVEMMAGDERQEQIVKWLANSPLAEPIEGGRGDFFVRQGSPVRLNDGTIVEAVSWLDSEGFDESLLVEGYTVSTQFLEQTMGEVMIFRKRQIVDAPFGFDFLEGPSDDFNAPDDIPF